MAAENNEVGSTVNESTESDFQIEKITAKNIKKTYGNKAFSLGSKTKGNGKLTYKTSDETTLKKISKLKSGTKYYVRVCSYKESSGEKIQGSYSKAKAVKVKVGKLERHTKIVYPQISSKVYPGRNRRKDDDETKNKENIIIVVSSMSWNDVWNQSRRGC